jgi:hypothetical protein
MFVVTGDFVHQSIQDHSWWPVLGVILFGAAFVESVWMALQDRRDYRKLAKAFEDTAKQPQRIQFLPEDKA